MKTNEEKMKDLLHRAETIESSFSGKYNQEVRSLRDNWMNDVEIFAEKCLKEHSLYKRLKTLLFQRQYLDVFSVLLSISNDEDFMNQLNGIHVVSVPTYQAKTLPEYDVFISHANADKEELIEDLYSSLSSLGIRIFYDKETLEWGDNWKSKILEGTQKSEFAIIVISENFFDREWTEKELAEFLSRQNKNGQKLILPILKNITPAQLKKKYPLVSDIQAIESSKFTTDQIALLFAKQLIKRLKAY